MTAVTRGSTVIAGVATGARLNAPGASDRAPLTAPSAMVTTTLVGDHDRTGSVVDPSDTRPPLGPNPEPVMVTASPVAVLVGETPVIRACTCNGCDTSIEPSARRRLRVPETAESGTATLIALSLHEATPKSPPVFGSGVPRPLPRSTTAGDPAGTAAGGPLLVTAATSTGTGPRPTVMVARRCESAKTASPLSSASATKAPRKRKANSTSISAPAPGTPNPPAPTT